MARELAAATASEDSAKRAIDVVRVEVESANRRVAEVDQALSLAGLKVGLEVAEPIAVEARAVMLSLASAKMRGQVVDRVLGGALAGMTQEMRSEYAPTFAPAIEAIRASFDVPRISDEAERAFESSVRRLLVALRTDAGATLESVQ